MKRYKFKLDALLKLREFEEQKIKIRLGEINKQISEIEAEISKDHRDLDEGYNSQNKLAASGTQGRMMQFYPMFTEGKRRHIEKLETELWSLKRKYQNTLEELKEARGKVKVVEKLKEKDKTDFRKEQTKIDDKKREDLVQMWSVNKENTNRDSE